MYSENLKNEHLSTEYLLHEYDTLISCETLGSYNCCEMISAFLWDREKKAASNVYTIFTLEERLTVEESSENLLPKLVSINPVYALGMQRKVLPADAVRELFEQLCTNRTSGKINLGEGELQIGILEGVPKIFVQQDSTKEILLNKILKNNFKNGSYILEFFDVEKSVSQSLNAKEFRKLTNAVYDIVPIDLFSLSDRIGNFIFQFPSLNVTASYHTDESEQTLTYQISMDYAGDRQEQFLLLSECTMDDTIVGSGAAIFSKEGTEITFEMGDASRICKTTVIDMHRQLILSQEETTLMRETSLILNMGSQYGEQRLIYDADGNVMDAIDINTSQNLHMGPPILRLRDDYIQRRQYSRRVDELYKRAEFRRYGKQAEPQTALQDVITLMNRISIGNVYLWDPYLTVEDLLHTWYYTTSMNVTLHAITSSEIAQKNNLNVKDWIAQQRELMDQRSNHYGIHAELRCQWCTHGYAFHDRFLMLLPADKRKTSVWSIGTSINSLGKKHHIIQSVEHPQLIVDTFEALWKDLDSEECLVWKKGL